MEEYKPSIIEDYLQCVVKELSSDEEISKANRDSSEGEEDYLEEQLENTDTEQEVSSGDESDSDGCTKSVLMGKDRFTKWTLRKSTHNVKPPVLKNFIPYVKVKEEPVQSMSPLWYWQLFFPDNLLNIIVNSTNEYIDSKKKNFSRERDCKLTDLIEIKAFIAVLYMAGFYRRSKLNLIDLWSKDGSGVEFFPLTLSEKRFYFLLRTISFDSRSTREERKRLDKMASVRDIFDMFVLRCQQNFKAEGCVTMDQTLLKFKGKCPFRQSIPRKSNKIGIKFFSLVDVKTLYTINLEIYVGEQADGPYKLNNDRTEIVKRLCEPITGSGRNVTGDSWFTSCELIEELRKLNLTYVGSVNKSKPELPHILTSARGRKPGTTIFAIHDGVTLLSHIPERKKNLLILSSAQYDNMNSITGPSKKPVMLDFYSNTKSAADAVDKLCITYSCARITNRWSMIIFYTMLNLAILNAHILHKGSDLQKFRHFIKAVALELAKDHMKRRSENSNLPRQLKRRATEMFNEIFNEPGSSIELKNIKMEDGVEGDKKCRKRCYICYRKKNRLTRYRCLKCRQFICLEHSQNICVNCNLENK